MTKHGDFEGSGQTVKTCLIELTDLWVTNYPLTGKTFVNYNFNMAECETSQVAIHRFKLRKSIILLEILEEGNKRENEGTRG